MANTVSCVELSDDCEDSLCDLVNYIESLSCGENKSKAKIVEDAVRNITHSLCNIEAEWNDIKALLFERGIGESKHAVIVTPDGFMLRSGEFKIDLLIITIDPDDLFSVAGYNSTIPRLEWQTEPTKMDSDEAKLLFSSNLFAYGLEKIAKSGISSDLMKWGEQKKFNWIVYREDDGCLFTSQSFLDKSAISDKHDIFEYQIVENKPQTSKVGNKMASTKVSATAAAVVGRNKDAAITAAKITAGKVAMKQVSKIIAPKIPALVRGYADTAVGRLVMANLFQFAVEQYMPNNNKAAIVADAMLQGAMVETLESFNVEELLESVLDKVDITKLTSKEEE